MHPRVLASILPLIAAVSCGGGAQGPSSGAPFPLFPMALVMTGGHDADEPIAVLGADGSISIRHRSFVGHLYPDRIVGPDGKVLVMAAPNGDVSIEPRAPPAHFDARGALVSPQGDVIWVDDGGVPSWAEPRGGMPALDVRFRPFTPAARRTAEVVFVVAMMVMWERGIST
jgi:hypothetical protein